MPDRTLNWGDPADAGTKYRTQDDDPAGGGNFVVAEDTDGNTILLQWNPTASQWEYGGPVDMDGNDLSNAGTVSATALEAGKLTTGRTWQAAGITINTTETNNYGSEIILSARLAVTSDNTAVGVEITIDGTINKTIDFRDQPRDDNTIISIGQTIPDGSDYKIQVFSGASDITVESVEEYRP